MGDVFHMTDALKRNLFSFLLDESVPILES
jgi:hypothetical protein